MSKAIQVYVDPNIYAGHPQKDKLFGKLYESLEKRFSIYPLDLKDRRLKDATCVISENSLYTRGDGMVKGEDSLSRISRFSPEVESILAFQKYLETRRNDSDERNLRTIICPVISGPVISRNWTGREAIENRYQGVFVPTDSIDSLENEIYALNTKDKVMKAGTCYIVSGSTGSGKTTLVNFVGSYLGQVETALKITTRRERLSENSGVVCCSEREFSKKDSEGRLVGVHEYSGSVYAYSLDDIMIKLSQGNDVVIDVVDEKIAQEMRDSLDAPSKIVYNATNIADNIENLQRRKQEEKFEDDLLFLQGGGLSEEDMDALKAELSVSSVRIGRDTAFDDHMDMSEISEDRFSYMKDRFSEIIDTEELDVGFADYIIPDIPFIFKQRMLRKIILGGRR